MIIGTVKLEHIKGEKNLFHVVSGFYYEDDKWEIEVLPGWITDGASVPKIFWNLFPPVSGQYLEAAILHDALYKSQTLSRKESDKIFLRAMKYLKVNFFKRYVMYFAVRLFGLMAWDNNKLHGIKKTCIVKEK